MDDLGIDALKAISKVAEFKAAFKNKALLNQTNFAIFLVDYKFGSAKFTSTLLFKKQGEAKAAMKSIKKDKFHKMSKLSFGQLIKTTANEWAFDVRGGGASLDIISIKANDLFSAVKINIKVQQGTPDPDMQLDAADLAEPDEADDTTPDTNTDTDADKSGTDKGDKTATKPSSNAEKIKTKLNEYNTALDTYAAKLSPKNLKLIYDTLDGIKTNLVTFRGLLAKEKGVDSEIIALLEQVDKKATELEQKITELEANAKNDSEVTGFSPQVQKVLQRFISGKNQIEKLMATEPNNPKIANAFKVLNNEYVKAKTEISTLTGTDTAAYEKALAILNAEKEKIDLLEVVASEKKEDAEDDTELQEELKAILKGKTPAVVFEEWDTELKSLQADIQTLLKKAQGAK